MASSPLTMRDFLAAGGKLGADLLAVDWSATPLGDPDDWPLSLRSAVRILVTSKFSMWLAWGPELTFFCNDAYRRDTLGKKYPWALGRPASLVWSEIWDEVSPRIEAVMATGEATWDEALQLFLERSGYVEETYHTFSYSPLADDDGSVSGMLCVVAEVTEQVVADRRMRTLRDLGVGISAASTEHQAVRAACDHLAGNPASLPFVAVYLFEDDGRSARLAGHTGFGEAHAALPALLSAEDDVWPLAAGWSGEATMVHDLSALSDRFGELPTGAWTEPPHTAFVTPILQPSEDHPYGVLVVGLNRYRPFDASYRDFVDLVAGHLSGAITDARAIEFQRQRAETLASLDQAKTDFLANVSHELRTPLTLLLGPAEDALTDLDEELAPSQRRRLEVITRNAQRMLQLVNSLLDYAKLEAGEDDGLFVETDVGRYTAELASMFESAASRVGLELAIDCASVSAHLDRDHWSKIVVNLVSNAMKFTLEGSVTITLREHDGHAVLTVSDSGTGIAEHELPRLFDRFHRVAGARSRTHEGSGIGLALVAELVAAHGGT
ncbi:MAG: ATP-binding protein, partial [Microbacterium sp.]